MSDQGTVLRAEARRPVGAGVTGLLRTEWSELGPAGRTVLVALVVAIVVAVGLGLTIPRQAERFLIKSELQSLQRAVDDLTNDGLLAAVESRDVDLIGAAVQRSLVGRETVRVKLWDRTATVIYSDLRELIGRQFPAPRDLADAIAGDPSAHALDEADPASVTELGLGPLYEFYIPVFGDEGSVAAVFEVYDRAEHVASSVADIRRTVWISVVAGVAVVTGALLVLLFKNARAIRRRRRLAEQLLGELITARDDERKKIIGALHDDIGQRLYRIHYGIEDTLTRAGPGSAVADELANVGQLVLEVDSTLRGQLRTLLEEPGPETDLATALEELVEVTEMETHLDVELSYQLQSPLPPPHRMTLYRAAREAIANVRKHAFATRVTLDVGQNGASAQLTVTDNGVGPTGDVGLGLATTKERLLALGGGLDVARVTDGSGTRFRAWVPVATGATE